MKTNLILLAFAFLGLLSCTKHESDAVTNHQGNPVRQVVLKIGVPQQCVSKSLTTDGESKINSLQVFVFRENGILDASAHGQSNAPLDVTTSMGNRTIAAVVNAPLIANIKSLEQFKKTVSEFTDNNTGNFIMSGIHTENILGAKTINVQVSRIVSRICVTSIINDFEEKAYQTPETEFIIKEIYLANIPSESAYYPGVNLPFDNSNLLNPLGNQDLSASECRDLVSSGVLSEKISYGTTYSVPHYFYSYPNPSTVAGEKAEGKGSICTRLVVSATLDTRPSYYVIPIDNIERNKSYNIRLTVTRPGSSDVGSDLITGGIKVDVTVSDWVQAPDKDVII